MNLPGFRMAWWKKHWVSTHIQFVLLSAVAFLQTQIRFRSSTGASMCIAALQPVACFFFSAWQFQGSEPTAAMKSQPQLCNAQLWSAHQVPTPHTPSQQFQLAKPFPTHQSPLQYPRLISQQITPWDNALHKLLEALPWVPLRAMAGLVSRFSCLRSPVWMPVEFPVIDTRLVLSVQVQWSQTHTIMQTYRRANILK